MKFAPKFEVGDIVVEKNSGKLAKITGIYSLYKPENEYSIKFLMSGLCSTVKQSSLILYTEPINTMQNTQTLYSFTKSDGSIGYATYLATNSAGKWVVEERDSGNIYIRSKDQFEEVVEYTIKVKNFVNRCGSHLKGIKEGDVVVGDIITDGYAIYMVVELNTKFKRATSFEGRKLLTQPL